MTRVGSGAGGPAGESRALEPTARLLLERYPLDRFQGKGEEAHAPVVFVGDSPMARAVLRQALLVGHFGPGHSLELLFFFEDLPRSLQEIGDEFPLLGGGAPTAAPDVEALVSGIFPKSWFYGISASAPPLTDQDTLLTRITGPRAATTIVVAPEEGSLAAVYASALLPPVALRARTGPGDVRVLYHDDDPDRTGRRPGEEGLAESPGVEVHPFGAFLHAPAAGGTDGLLADDLAKEIAAHYRETFGGMVWDELAEADRTASRRAADHVPVKLRAVGAEIVGPDEDDDGFRFQEDELAMLAEMEHRRWCAGKLLDGWRLLARTPENLQRWREDREELKARRLHPDLVPFEELDEEGRDKDRAQIEGIPRFLRAVGKGVRRRF